MVDKDGVGAQTARMWATAFQVAIGGAIGSAARFGVGVWLARFSGSGFPVGVLAVNIVGSFLMGLAVVYLGQRGLPHLTPLLMTGVLGGFTTFSAFSLEAYTMFERGQVGQAALYVGLSVGLSLLALVLGVLVMRSAMT